MRTAALTTLIRRNQINYCRSLRLWDYHKDYGWKGNLLRWINSSLISTLGFSAHNFFRSCRCSVPSYEPSGSMSCQENGAGEKPSAAFRIEFCPLFFQDAIISFSGWWWWCDQCTTVRITKMQIRFIVVSHCFCPLLFRMPSTPFLDAIVWVVGNIRNIIILYIIIRQIT